jgi:hypothetical protein
MGQIRDGKIARAAQTMYRSGQPFLKPLIPFLLAAVVAPSLATAAPQADEPWVAEATVAAPIRSLLLSLKTAEFGIPYKLRERLLDRIESIEVAGRGAAPDHYYRANAEGFSLIVRSFEGVSTRDTVYLLQFGADLRDCTELKPWLEPRDRVGQRFCQNDPERGEARIVATGASRFGFAAYRDAGGGRLKNVTHRVFPKDPFFRLPAQEREGVHDAAGLTSGSWVNLSRLSEVPVMRLYLEYGDGYGLPRSHPRAFSSSGPGELVQAAHLGFLVWNGRDFELRQTVPRALWPCRHDQSFHPSGQSCDSEYPDRFVSPSNAPPKQKEDIDR